MSHFVTETQKFMYLCTLSYTVYGAKRSVKRSVSYTAKGFNAPCQIPGLLSNVSNYTRISTAQGIVFIRDGTDGMILNVLNVWQQKHLNYELLAHLPSCHHIHQKKITSHVFKTSGSSTAVQLTWKTRQRYFDFIINLH